MASLTGQSIANTYDSLLKLTDNEPLTSSLKVVTDGLGNSSVLQLSTLEATLTGALNGTSATFASTSYTNLYVNGTNVTGWGNNIAFKSEGVDFGFVGSLGSLLGNTTKDMTIYATTGNGFRVYTNGNNRRFEIDSSGGATFTGALSGTSATFSGNVVSNGSYIQVSNAINPSLYIFNSTAGVQWQNYVKSNSNLAFSDAVRDVLTLGYNGSASFFQGGNVLIGTTTDAGYKLDVNGTGRFSNTVSIVANSSAQNLLIQGRSSDNFGQILFYSNDGLTRYGYLQGGSAYGGTVALVGDGGGRIDLDNRGITLNQALSGTSATFSSTITTASPSGGTARPFKVGSAASVSPTSPNRTIEIEIDGTTYYLSAKTTND